MGKRGEILKILEEKKEEIKKRFKVREISVFGSFIRGEEGKRSDVDILVEFEEIPDLFEFLELEMYLERILKVKVDMVRKQALRKELKQKILKEAVKV